VTSVGLCSTSHVNTFEQNWHRLYSISAGRKDLFNDTQIRVIGSIEPEIRTKMLKIRMKIWEPVNNCSKKIRKGEKGKGKKIQNFNLCA